MYTPVIWPVPATAVAMAVLLLPHVPPEGLPPKETVAPITMPGGADIVGNVFTVTVVPARQPVARVYMTTAVPVADVVIIPVALPTLTLVPALTLHVPPDDPELLSVDVLPMHMPISPVIAAGNGFTVIVVAVPQPLDSA
jgi:hypothetical protein